jgi:hypothetical protein
MLMLFVISLYIFFGVSIQEYYMLLVNHDVPGVDL